MSLVRHYDQDERETDGADHGKSMGQHCDKRFRKLEDTNSLTLIGSSISTKEATKPGSNIAKKPKTFALFKDTLVGT